MCYNFYTSHWGHKIPLLREEMAYNITEAQIIDAFFDIHVAQILFNAFGFHSFNVPFDIVIVLS